MSLNDAMVCATRWEIDCHLPLVASTYTHTHTHTVPHTERNALTELGLNNVYPCLTVNFKCPRTISYPCRCFVSFLAIGTAIFRAVATADTSVRHISTGMVKSALFAFSYTIEPKDTCLNYRCSRDLLRYKRNLGCSALFAFSSPLAMPAATSIRKYSE